MTTKPSEHVLDLFAVPNNLTQLGDQGPSFRAGDLILCPGHGGAVQEWLSPVLARLALDLDTRPGQDRRDLRVAMPVPARNGEWVVDGWAAYRYEPGSRPLRDLAVIRAVGALLHAELATCIDARPLLTHDTTARQEWAERAAFGEVEVDVTGRAAAEPLVRALLAERDLSADLGQDQLVHGDLARNVLLDAHDAPVVIDLTPCWRPPLWADAVCVLDSALLGDDPVALEPWPVGLPRQAMVRAALFRMLADPDPDVDVYLRVLTCLLPSVG